MELATSSAPVTLEDVLKMQTECVRDGEFNERNGTGSYIVLGRMIELRHEIAKNANEPDREVSRTVGVVMDWRHFHSGPLLGLTKDRRQILILSKVPPLPDIVDPNWVDTQMVEMSYGRIRAAALTEQERKALGITLKEPPKIKQRFIEHMSGKTKDDKFMVCRPLTQILFKIDGVQGFTIIDFTGDSYTGEHAAFFLDPLTGEGHIYGGEFQIAALKTQ